MQPSEVVPVSPPGAALPALPASPLDLRFEDLVANVRRLRPNEDISVLERAYKLATEAHAKQLRASGEPYISHPLAVAHILADMQMDMACLETGLLHDIVEDTSVTIDAIRKEFGDEVARCVDGVTKLSKLALLLARGPAGRERPQDAAGDGERHPRDHRQAGRPAAQHAHAGMPAAGAAGAHRAGDARDLRAHRAPPGNGQDARRTGGSLVPVSGARSLGGV